MTDAVERHLIIMGIRGVPAAHGGFETFAERLALFLRDRGWTVTVYCQGGSRSGRIEERDWQGITCIHVPVRSGGAGGTVEFDIRCIADVARRPGTILTLGYNTGFLSIWLRLRKRINCINMDGMEWRREKYGPLARMWLWINERMAAFSGTGLIADHPRIEERLRRIAPRADVTMIPYGGDHAEMSGEKDDALAPLGLTPRTYFTLIARPEPENSVAEIVAAFSAEQPGPKLVVLGAYDPRKAYHAKVMAAAGPDVLFPGAIFDKAMLQPLRRNSIAYFHGHKVGGTNPSLVEALAAGNLVIAHDNIFNRWVAGDAAFYFTDIASIRTAIRDVMNDAQVCTSMRAKALQRWDADFTWPVTLEKYETLLLRMGARRVPDAHIASSVPTSA